MAADLLRQRASRRHGRRGAPADLRNDGRRGRGRGALESPVEVLALDAVDPQPFDLVVDALFGAGLSRALEGPALGIVERVNAASGTPVLAVDLPSGLSGDTGQVLGPVASWPPPP